MPYIFVRSNVKQVNPPEDQEWVNNFRKHMFHVNRNVLPPEFQWTTHIDWSLQIYNEDRRDSLESVISSDLNAKRLGDPNYFSYRTNKSPCEVLDVLEREGCKVVATSASGDTYTWTLERQQSHS